MRKAITEGATIITFLLVLLLIVQFRELSVWCKARLQPKNYTTFAGLNTYRVGDFDLIHKMDAIEKIQDRYRSIDLKEFNYLTSRDDISVQDLIEIVLPVAQNRQRLYERKYTQKEIEKDNLINAYRVLYNKDQNDMLLMGDIEIKKLSINDAIRQLNKDFMILLEDYK